MPNGRGDLSSGRGMVQHFPKMWNSVIVSCFFFQGCNETVFLFIYVKKTLDNKIILIFCHTN
jgi:hypothetical protein